jgi:hypothetical protein
MPSELNDRKRFTGKIIRERPSDEFIWAGGDENLASVLEGKD